MSLERGDGREPWEGSAVSRSPVKTEDSSDDVSWKEGRMDVVVQAAEDNRDGGLAESNAFHRTKSRVDRTHARRTEVTPTSGSQRRQKSQTHTCTLLRAGAVAAAVGPVTCAAAALLPRPARVPTRLAALSTARPDNDSRRQTPPATRTHTYTHTPAYNTSTPTPQISYRRHTHARAILRALVAIAGLTAAPPDLISLPADRVQSPPVQFS